MENYLIPVITWIVIGYLVHVCYSVWHMMKVRYFMGQTTLEIFELRQLIKQTDQEGMEISLRLYCLKKTLDKIKVKEKEEE